MHLVFRWFHTAMNVEFMLNICQRTLTPHFTCLLFFTHLTAVPSLPFPYARQTP